MLVVKDSMVLIHLAKITLLETSCKYFGRVFIPQKVKEEVLMLKYEDAKVTEDLLSRGKIKVKAVKNKKLIKKSNQFNIQNAEAEAVALYWELKADLIATDDDNVRKKREVLKLNVIGTPAVLLKLYAAKKISRVKLEEAIKKMQEVGWFSNTVWDKIKLEADKK